MAQQQAVQSPALLPGGPTVDVLGNPTAAGLVAGQLTPAQSATPGAAALASPSVPSTENLPLTPPSGGASIFQRLSAQNSPHLQKFQSSAKAALDSDPAGAAKPGGWAKALVGGAIDALGDAAAAGAPAPNGGGALTGIARTLQARGQRIQGQQEAASKEKTQDLLRAETMQRIVSNTRNTYRQDQETRTASYKDNAAFMDKIRQQHDVQDNVTQDQLNDMLKKDPNFWKTHTGRPTGEEPVFDGAKPRVENGNTVTSPLYSVASIQAKDGGNGGYEVTPEESKFFELGGNHIQAGTHLNLDQYNSANATATARSNAQLAIEKANKEKMSSEQSKQLDAILQDPHIQHYVAMNPELGALGGLTQAQKNTQDHISSLDQKIAAVQKAAPGQDNPVLQQLQQERQRQVEGGQKIEKAMSGFNEAAHKDYETRLDEQRKEAETERHNKMDEQNKAAELKAKEGGFLGNPNAASPQEFLQSLDPQARSIVQLIGTGKAPLSNPGYLLARKPEILEAVAKAYPEFDISKVGSYQSTYKDFTSGKSSVELKSGGTALGHLRELKDLNTAASHIPHTPAWTAYQNKVDTLATELAKFYGDATVPAIANIKETLNSTLPGNREAAIRTQAQSMGDRYESMENEWTNAAPSKAYQAPMPGFSLQAKQARAALDPNYASQHPELGVKTPALPQAALSQLKEGQHTKFGNGQTWTLQGGKPVQVQGQ